MADIRPLKRYQRAGLYLGPILGFLVWFFADLDPDNVLTTRMAAAAVWMAVWWITEAVPLALTALLPVVLFPVLGVMSGKSVAGHYFNDIIFLFLGGFMVAVAMERWHLHRRLALKILMLCGLRPRTILLGFMGATAFLSMWISNTATAMMMTPIALAILIRLEDLGGKEEMRRYGTGVLLGIAYGASIGGIATLVGTPPNLVFSKVYPQQFPNATPISFANWFVFGVPLAIVMLGLTWGWLAWTYRATATSFGEAQVVLRQEYQKLGAMGWEEKVVAVDFVALALLWLTRKGIAIGDFAIPGWSEIRFGDGTLFPDPSFITDGTVAIALGVVLFLIPASRASGMNRILDRSSILSLPWNIVLLFGGGFALAAGFQDSELSQWVGSQLAGLKVLPPLLIVLCVCLVLTFLTELTSNTATANILLPILAANAVALDMDPLLLMVPGTISCSMAFMLPVATPPNAIVFGSQRIDAPEMAKTGLVLNLMGAVVITLAIFTLGRWVFGIE